MNTPADKPDLPPHVGEHYDDEAKVVHKLYSENQVRILLDDERRKTLEEAEARLRQRLDAAKHVHKASGGSYSEGMRDAYDVAVLDIGSMIDRKEPTK